MKASARTWSHNQAEPPTGNDCSPTLSLLLLSLCCSDSLASSLASLGAENLLLHSSSPLLFSFSSRTLRNIPFAFLRLQSAFIPSFPVSQQKMEGCEGAGGRDEADVSIPLRE